MNEIDSYCWSLESLEEAVEAVARASGLAKLLAPVSRHSQNIKQKPFRERIEDAAASLGLEVQAVDVGVGEVENLLPAGPALLRVDNEGQPRFLALLRAGRRRARVVTPDGEIRRLGFSSLVQSLGAVSSPTRDLGIDQVLGQAGLSQWRIEKARQILLGKGRDGTVANQAWLFRPPTEAGIWRHACRWRAPHFFSFLVAGQTLQIGLLILAWWVLGEGVLGGKLDLGWLATWALLLATAAPVRIASTWLQGKLGIAVGGLLKERLLVGALKLSPDKVRQWGVGQILSRILESSNLESLALNGGFLVLAAVVELVMAGFVLGFGAGASVHLALLALWIVPTLWMARNGYRRRLKWGEARLELAQDLIEGMIGHRTRVAQENRTGWHDREDLSLEAYLDKSMALDRLSMMQAGMARGWLLVGLLGMAPGFVEGTTSEARLAVILGGILLAHMAFEKLGNGLASLLSAAVAWRQLSVVIEAANSAEEGSLPTPFATDPAAAGDQTLIEAHQLAFQHNAASRPVLRGVDLRIRFGDRILLQGPSGGGKSTLASLLTGLRRPDSGLLLLRGLDYQSLGPQGWGSRVASSPQFHENHVFSGTFAFNLLMGRQWPPSQGDLVEAEGLCRELGLGELIDRMPGGMMQTVGETGWQLSHGERGRLFMARALLQKADLVLLDESFAALDPQTLTQCLEIVNRRAKTLLAIAHV